VPRKHFATGWRVRLGKTSKLPRNVGVGSVLTLAPLLVVSDSPPLADMAGSDRHLGLAPRRIRALHKLRDYSITSSARATKVGGISSPIDLAVVRFTTKG